MSKRRSLEANDPTAKRKIVLRVKDPSLMIGLQLEAEFDFDAPSDFCWGVSGLIRVRKGMVLLSWNVRKHTFQILSVTAVFQEDADCPPRPSIPVEHVELSTVWRDILWYCGEPVSSCFLVRGRDILVTCDSDRFHLRPPLVIFSDFGGASDPDPWPWGIPIIPRDGRRFRAVVKPSL